MYLLNIIKYNCYMFVLCCNSIFELKNYLNFNIKRKLKIIYFPVAITGNHNDNSSSSSPEESSQGENNSRTQYISATCVVVTHYSGDVASVVDEHFTRALNFNDKNSKGKLKPLFFTVITFSSFCSLYRSERCFRW